MKTEYLVLGATGSIGYAFTKTLIDEKVPVTILVRNKEKASVQEEGFSGSTEPVLMYASVFMLIFEGE